MGEYSRGFGGVEVLVEVGERADSFEFSNWARTAMIADGEVSVGNNLAVAGFALGEGGSGVSCYFLGLLAQSCV